MAGRKASKGRRAGGLDALSCVPRGLAALAMLLLSLGVLAWCLTIGPLLLLQIDRPAGSAVQENKAVERSQQDALVDVTTKGLYDSIAFDDVDGGAWKQGWSVSYRGDEWNQEPLNVFVVPHSHNDPGWIRTVEEYYQERTRHILSTIIRSLLKDKRRKFIWEEMSYLHRWWQDASATEKADLTRLVKNGQLEIVGGGWVMNDEANSHYYAILEQMFAGNIWLLDTLGVVPKNSWAIDPFGHSATMAYLLRRMGFDNMLIQRTHYEVKKVLAREQSLEFRWRQTWDVHNTTDMLCHMMPFYSYDIPHTCGPEPAVCCQFDYWRLTRVGGAQRCPWGYNPEEITSDNVKERAMLLLDQYRKKSTLYKSSTLLVPLGDDFRYVTPVEAELQYTNYQAMFDYINANSQQLKAQVQFGTLADYFNALRSEASSKAPELGFFPSLSGDFFTYADRAHDYWSGYYVTRPFYKAVDRVLEHTLRAADILFTYSGARCSAHAASLDVARRNLALFQHHDGVTGTAKDHVVEDYGMRMHSSLLELQSLMSATVEAVLDDSATCNATASSTAFEPEQLRSKFNVLALRKALTTYPRSVVLFNPLEEVLEQVVTIVTEKTSVCVLDALRRPVQSQVSPEWLHDGTTIPNRHRLQWTATIPALGMTSYLVMDSTSECTVAERSSLTVFNRPHDWSCPEPYSCTVGQSDTVEISNEQQVLGLNTRTGLVRWLRQPQGGDAVVAVEEDLCYYSSMGSGAYLFLPDGQAQSLVTEGGLVVVTTGSLMEEAFCLFKSTIGGSPVSRSARLYKTSPTQSVQALSVEMQYHVELLDNRFNNKEVVARYRTGLDSGKAFFSDLNGFQTIRRETYDKIPLQGNYYPMPSLAFLQDEPGRRFSVHSRQAVGVASLQTGWLEMMLDRRLTRDDGRGLGQGVLDNRPLDVHFQLLLELNVSSSPSPLLPGSRQPSLLSHRIGAQLNYPLHAFFAKRQQVWPPQALLTMDLPCNMHLVSLKALRPGVSGTEYGLILQRRGWDSSYSSTCLTHNNNTDTGIGALFQGLAVHQVIPSSLGFLTNEEDPGFFSKRGRKRKRDAASANSILPMEMQAYKLVTTHSSA